MAWCPLGYVSIVELIEVIEVNSDLIAKEAHHFLNINNENNRAEDEDKISPWDCSLVVQGKILENFLHKNAYKAIACSSSGQLFKISRVLMRPPIYNHWYSFDERFRKNPELLYVDIYNGVIDLCGTATRMETQTDFTDGKDWELRARERFSHLDGWSVCFREDEIDMSPAAIEGLWTPQKQEKVIRIGRPMIAVDAAKSYRARYPNGHSECGKLWKEIEFEFGVSSKTIRTGLKILEEEAGKNAEKSD